MRLKQPKPKRPPRLRDETKDSLVEIGIQLVYIFCLAVILIAVSHGLLWW